MAAPPNRKQAMTLIEEYQHDRDIHLPIQRAILEAINDPQFSAALPPLSDQAWSRILGPTPYPEDNYRRRQENERLEFLGDALMYSTIGRQLYKQLPDGTPDLYTVCPPISQDHLT